MRFNPRQEEAAGEHTLEWPWHATWVCQANPAHIEVVTPAEEKALSGRSAAVTMTEPERRHLVICNVTQVIHEFIGCAGDQQTPPRWINLRNVQEITPAPER